MLLDDLVARDLVRERAAEAHAWARIARLEAHRQATEEIVASRRTLVSRISDLGRLALVALVVMAAGIGIVGLFTAGTEPRPPRAEVLEGLTDGDRWATEPFEPRAAGRGRLAPDSSASLTAARGERAGGAPAGRVHVSCTGAVSPA